jgi:hypothetical protein
MNTTTRFLHGLVALAALAFAAPLAAQTIHRCEAEDGMLVFTDQQCHLLGTAYGLESEPVRARPGMRRTGVSGSGLRFGIGCAARSPEGLLGAVKREIESGDVNQLAGLYDWNGANRAHAMGVVRRMQRLVKRDLLTVEFDYADYAPTFTFEQASQVFDRPARPALPDIVVAHYAWGRGGASEGERFSTTRAAGCVWLAG